MLIFFIRQEIRTATSSMTSVPKPLKFLRPHYGTLQAHYEKMAESDLKVKAIEFDIMLSNFLFLLASFSSNYYLLTSFTPLQKLLADILSVLALTMSPEGERVCFYLLFAAIAYSIRFHFQHPSTCLRWHLSSLLQASKDLYYLFLLHKMQKVDLGHASWLRSCIFTYCRISNGQMDNGQLKSRVSPSENELLDAARGHYQFIIIL